MSASAVLLTVLNNLGIVRCPNIPSVKSDMYCLLRRLSSSCSPRNGYQRFGPNWNRIYLIVFGFIIFACFRTKCTQKALISLEFETPQIWLKKKNFSHRPAELVTRIPNSRNNKKECSQSAPSLATDEWTPFFLSTGSDPPPAPSQLRGVSLCKDQRSKIILERSKINDHSLTWTVRPSGPSPAVVECPCQRRE